MNVHLAFVLASIEAAVILAHHLINRRFDHLKAVYIATALIAAYTASLLWPRLGLGEIIGSLKGVEEALYNAMNVVTGFALAYSAFLTILNLLGLMGFLPAYAKLAITYASLSVAKIYDPLTALIYTTLSVTQALYAMAHSVLELAKALNALGPIAVSLAFPLLIVRRLRPLAISLITITAVLCGVVYSASAYITGVGEISELLNRVEGVLKGVNNTIQGVIGSTPLTVRFQSELPMIVSAKIGGIKAIISSPSSIVIPAKSDQVELDYIIVYWLNMTYDLLDIGVKRVNKSLIHVVIDVPGLNPIYTNGVLTGVWMVLHREGHIDIRQIGNSIRIYSSLRPHENASLKLWLFTGGVELKCRSNGLVDVNARTLRKDVYEPADLSRLNGLILNYVNELKAYYEPYIRWRPRVCLNEGLPVKSRQYVVLIHAHNIANKTGVFECEVRPKAGDPWLHTSFPPYIDMIDEYLRKDGDEAVTSYLWVKEAKLPGILDLIPAIFTHWSLLESTIAGILFLIGSFDMFSIALRLWHFIMYDLSLITYLKVFSGLPGRLLAISMRRGAQRVMSKLTMRYAHVGIGRLFHSAYKAMRLLKPLTRGRRAYPIGRIGREYARMLSLGSKGLLPLFAYRRDLSRLIDSRLTYDLLRRRPRGICELDLIDGDPASARRRFIKAVLSGEEVKGFNYALNARRRLYSYLVERLMGYVFEKIDLWLETGDKGVLEELVYSDDIPLLHNVKKRRIIVGLVLKDVYRSIRGYRWLLRPLPRPSRRALIEALRIRLLELYGDFLQRSFEIIGVLRALNNGEMGLIDALTLLKRDLEAIGALEEVRTIEKALERSRLGISIDVRDLTRYVMRTLLDKGLAHVLKAFYLIEKVLPSVRYGDVALSGGLRRYLTGMGFEDALRAIENDKISRELISLYILSTTRTNPIDLALTFGMHPIAALLQFLNRDLLSQTIESLFERGLLSRRDLVELAPAFRQLELQFKSDVLSRIVEVSDPDESYFEFLRACLKCASLLMRKGLNRATPFDLWRAYSKPLDLIDERVRGILDRFIRANLIRLIIEAYIEEARRRGVKADNALLILEILNTKSSGKPLI